MKKRNSTSSNDVYKYNKKTPTEKIPQKQILLSLIKIHGPCTSRTLTVLSGIERSSITNHLFKLGMLGRVKVVYRKHCPITGRLVKYYSAKAKKGGIK